jgi:uncharacterized tellurite resistance protein B-like protein
MISVLKKMFNESDGTSARAISERERHHLKIAVASLFHEASRVDLDERREEQLAAERALEDLFGLPADDCIAVLAEGRGKAQQLVSYFAPVSIIKRDFSLAERVRFIEHLWRIAYADGRLDPYEDHFVRKIAHLLYVPNTQCILARNRARPLLKAKA